jgi:iron complex transport system substrate-binding protein
LLACGGAASPGSDPRSGAGTTPQPALSGPEAGAPAAYPLTLIDDAGRQVTIRQQPKRIVSAAPSNTEILFALGLGERVVGVTNFCDYPEEATTKPKIGGLRPSLEIIVAQEPDLVLGIRGTPLDAIAVLEGQQIPVVILNPADFGGVLANIRAVGRIAGAAAAAETLTARMQSRWNAVAERAKLAAKKPRILFEIDATDTAAVSVAGPGTFIDAMIATAGGVNIFATLTPGQQYPKIGGEVVLQADPEIIILGNAAFGQSMQTVSRRPGWSETEAVRRGAVVPMADPNLTSRAGPRLVDGLEEVARAIHPELFGAPTAPTGSTR